LLPQPTAASSEAAATYDAFLATVRGSTATLTAAGYDEMVFEDYLDETLALFENARSWTKEELEVQAADEGLWNGVGFFLKLLTAAHIKLHPDDFTPFIASTTGLSITAFCSSQVEAMWVECDHLQIVAAVGALGVAAQIWYLDGAGGEINGHIFPDGAAPLVSLLFRPGHYDVLNLT
jgi:hypothetical protein